MKNLIKSLIVLSILLVPNTLSAGKMIDDTLKNQCKYIVYGQLEGRNNDQADGYLLGFIQGVEYMTDKTELTEFFTSRNYHMVKERACENALKNSTKKGFQADYKLEAYKLISTK
jgi:hypothetical protein